jgi:DNA-binding transcriptional ArsR family regulator
MNSTVAVTPSKLIYMGGIAVNGGPPSRSLPPDLNKIMVRFAFALDKGAVFKTISDAVYELCQANAEGLLTKIVEYTKSQGVSPDVVNQAVKDGRERWNSSQPDTDPLAPADGSATSGNGKPRKKHDVDDALAARGTTGTPSTQTAKPTKAKVIGVEIPPPYTLRPGEGDPLEPWIDLILADRDRGMTKNRLKFAMFLVAKIHRKSGWLRHFSIQQIADALGVDPSTIKRTWKYLERRGLLFVQRHRGCGKLSLCRPCLPEKKGGDYVPPFTDHKGGSHAPPFQSDKRGQVETEKVAIPPVKGGKQQCPTDLVTLNNLGAHGARARPMNGRSRAGAKANPPTEPSPDNIKQQCMKALGKGDINAGGALFATYSAEKQKRLIDDFGRYGSNSLALADAVATQRKGVLQ